MRISAARVALVPTMGALHAGHIALVEAARGRGAQVVVSIFVNPTQFGPNEDLDAYPRREASDVALLEAAGAALLWAPDVATMYPPGFATSIDVGGVSARWDGTARPGHFAGVATVVTKLLQQVRPDVALFGEKDYQQLTVIRRVVQDLNVPVRIVGAPTVRAEDGLALSSRNRYLEPRERAAAPAIYRALDRARRRLESGDTAFGEIEAEGLAAISAAGIKPDYFEVRTADRLDRPSETDVDLVVLTAGRLGKARLIDNLQCRAPLRK